ncbi:MAG: cupin domain-containing protein [Verrucomicrobiia bacterium]
MDRNLSQSQADVTPGNNGSAASVPSRRLKRLWSSLAALAVLLCSSSAMALSITPLGQGVLPSGEIISTVQVVLDPGDIVPWHYHSGPGWGTILSGTLTHDEGCGNPLVYFQAGSAFAEEPGEVHRALNEGTEPVVLIWTEIYGACHQDWIYVDGPRCQGASGRSHLEKTRPCP